MSEQSDLVEKLVGELVATGTLWPETAADLQRFVEEAKAGHALGGRPQLPRSRCMPR